MPSCAGGELLSEPVVTAGAPKASLTGLVYIAFVKALPFLSVQYLWIRKCAGKAIYFKKQLLTPSMTLVFQQHLLPHDWAFDWVRSMHRSENCSIKIVSLLIFFLQFILKCKSVSHFRGVLKLGSTSIQNRVIQQIFTRYLERVFCVGEVPECKKNVLLRLVYISEILPDI